MRPSVVLTLVLAAVGALLVALLTLGPSSETDDAVEKAATNVSNRAAAGPAPAVPIAAADSIPTPERTITQAPLSSEQREIVASGAEAFGSSLKGTVLDPTGVPVADAVVILERGTGPGGLGNLGLLMGTAGPAPELRSVNTDESGGFEILEVKPGDDYQLTAKHELYATTKLNMVVVRANEQTVEEIKMTAGFAVHGYVHDNVGAVVEGAQLRLVDLLHAQLPPGDPRVDAALVETDAQGYYRFDHVAPGMRSLSVSMKGFGSQTANNLNVGGQKPTVPRDFILQPGLSIAGQVVSPTRQPVAGVRIRAISYDSGMNSTGFATSDGNGNFSMEDMTEGNYSLIADASGWGTARLNRVEGGDTGVLIEMIEQGRVSGRVLTESGNSPVPDFDVQVRVVIPESTVFGRSAGNAQVRGAKDGYFEVAGLDKGTYVVEATAPGFAPAYSESFEVAQSLLTSDIVVKLSAGGTLTGRLVSGKTGEPVAGAVVTSHDNIYVRHALVGVLGGMVPRTTTDRRSVTDENGQFTLPNLWPDVYQINVAHPDYMRLVQKDIRVQNGSQPTDLGTIRLDVGGSVTGTVYDSIGQPVPNSTVNLSGNSQEATAFYDVRTGSDGRYLIRNAVPGQYNLHATRQFDQANPFGAIIDMNHSKVTVNVSNGTTVNQDLHLGE